MIMAKRIEKFIAGENVSPLRDRNNHSVLQSTKKCN